MTEIDEMLIDLHATEQPAADELAGSPVLDNWVVGRALAARPDEGPWFARGIVSRSPKFRDGSGINSSEIVSVDSELRWIRTQNTLYLLGVEYDEIPLIMRAATSGSRLGAYIVVNRATGEHTLPSGVYAAAQAAGYTGDDSDDKIKRDAANAVGDRLAKDGRLAVANAWWMLGCDGSDRKQCDDVHTQLVDALGSNHPTETMRGVVVGWCSLGAGRDWGEDLSDPIAAARIIGEKSKRPGDLLKGLQTTGDVLDELAVGPTDEEPAAGGPGVIVVKALGGLTRTSAGNDAKAEFRELIGKPVPLVPVPDLVLVRRALMAEFPYAGRLIDVLLSDLTGREAVRFRPTLIFGPPGCGKSRLIRKLGTALGLHVGRYDASGAGDNTFGGTARRWSSGEPSWPLLVIKSAGHANPIVHVDEIDKTATSRHNGSLDRALLPVLEIETATRYPDPWVQSDINLSHVSFLLTANDDTELAAPLRDRLRVLRMPRIEVEHVIAVAGGIVADLAAERGLDARWVRPLDGDEIEIAQRMLGDGSARRLRAIVDRLLTARESREMKH